MKKLIISLMILIMLISVVYSQEGLASREVVIDGVTYIEFGDGTIKPKDADALPLWLQSILPIDLYGILQIQSLSIYSVKDMGNSWTVNKLDNNDCKFRDTGTFFYLCCNEDKNDAKCSGGETPQKSCSFPYSSTSECIGCGFEEKKCTVSNDKHRVNIIRESNGVCSYSPTEECGSNEICKNGACVSSGCSDEEGDKPFVFGTTIDSGGTSHPDRCTTGKTLFESVCENNLFKAKRYYCSNGCANGACIEGSCVDGDALNEFKKDSASEETGVTISDTCVDGNTVKEAFCDDKGKAQSKNINCPFDFECKDGRCLEPPSIVKPSTLKTKEACKSAGGQCISNCEAFDRNLVDSSIYSCDDAQWGQTKCCFSKGNEPYVEKQQQEQKREEQEDPVSCKRTSIKRESLSTRSEATLKAAECDFTTDCCPVEGYTADCEGGDVVEEFLPQKLEAHFGFTREGLCVADKVVEGGEDDGDFGDLNPCNFGESIAEGFGAKKPESLGCAIGWGIVILGIIAISGGFGGRRKSSS